MSETPSPQRSSPASQAIVFWVLWLSMSTGVVLIRVFIAPPSRSPPAPAHGFAPVEAFALGAAFASVLVRWFVLPHLKTLQKKFPAFVIGCALAEACGMLGSFVSPSHGPQLFVASLLGLAQMMPLFALPRAETFPRADR